MVLCADSKAQLQEVEFSAHSGTAENPGRTKPKLTLDAKQAVVAPFTLLSTGTLNMDRSCVQHVCCCCVLSTYDSAQQQWWAALLLACADTLSWPLCA